MSEKLKVEMHKMDLNKTSESMTRIKSLLSFLYGIILLFAVCGNAYGQAVIPGQKDPVTATYISLGGQSLTKGNLSEDDSLVLKFKSSVLHLFRTKTIASRGVILLFPGGTYGIRAICLRVCSKVSNSRIILMAVFPREQYPTDPRRILINEINNQLKTFANDKKITFIDIGNKMLDANGVFLPGLTSDFCHPTEKGYQIWADAIRSLIFEPR